MIAITLSAGIQYNSLSQKNALSHFGGRILMSEEKKSATVESVENKYLSVLAASKRARQLLERAEKHNLSVDTEKVLLQSLNEFLSGKVTYIMTDVPVVSKKKSKAKD
jgi:DNA-directed RNA polymerase subunit K/omega